MQYFMDYNNQVQWHPPPVFSPQWDTLLSQGHFFPGQMPTESVAEPENIMFWGSGTDENHVVGVTDQNAHYMPEPYTTGEYEESAQMPGGVLQDDVDDSLDVFNGDFPQLPDFSLMEETFNVNGYPFVTESPPQPDYILLGGTFDNMLNVDCSMYGSIQAAYSDYGSESPGSSVSSDTSHSFPGVYNNLDFYGNLSTNFLPAPNDVDPPTFENHPAAYDNDSPSSSEWSSASPITALGAFESGSGSISTYPTYPDYPASLYDNAPSNTSTMYDNSLNGALGVDLQLDQWEETVDGTPETQAPESWFVGQGADVVAIVPAENENTENNINPQQTWTERSAWDVNSFCEEGVDAFTNKSDHDTGAGPSTGSGVAAAMLDIEQAWHGQRDDGATNISADMTERRNGKRKAEDAPDASDAPEASKRLRMEPAAPSMGDSIADQYVEDPAISFGNFQQKSIREFRLILAPETTNGSEGRLPISGQSSTFMTLKIEMDGTLTPRSTVVARDSHANRRPK